MGDPISSFLARPDEVLRDGALGLLCNQTSFDPGTGEYLFTALDRRGNLRRLFVPEHGLFGELQDQVGLVRTDVYDDLELGAEVVSLYGEDEASLAVDGALVADLDALVVDLQDVGSRYYTFATTLRYVLDVLAAERRQVAVWVVDRPNPAGRQVEGVPLAAGRGSFVGTPGLPHRHGLTIGELARFHHEESGAPGRLEVVPLAGGEAWNGVAPSPNLPRPETARFYSGQCLLEGTNVSEGRGTTRPFEVFGAPFLRAARAAPPAAAGARLRPTRFVPAFHKHAGRTCHGFQIHLTGGRYHALAHGLRLIRWIRETWPEAFAWRQEAYEFRSDRAAIDLLVGDGLLLDYLHGRADLDAVERRLEEGERGWIARAKRWTLYDEPLHRAL